MNDPPEPRPKDPLFDHVEEWRADFDEVWFLRFARCVICGFVGGIITLALLVWLR